MRFDIVHIYAAFISPIFLVLFQIAHSIYDVNFDYSWSDLSDSQFQGWYEELDRCILRESRTVFSDPRKIKQEKCGSKNANLEEFDAYNIGYGYNGKICIPPLTDRKHFKKSLPEFLNPFNSYLIPAIDSIINSNRTLVFYGDSMTGQVYEAIFSEIIRTLKLNNTIYAHYKYSQQPLSSASLSKLRSNILKTGGRYDTLCLNHRNITIYWIRMNYIDKIENSTYYGSNITGTWKETKPIINALLHSYAGIVMIANIGLWYNDRYSYQIEMTPFLQWLNNLSLSRHKTNHIIWRETTCSHFDRLPSGYYKHKDRNHKSCVPIGYVRTPTQKNPSHSSDSYTNRSTAADAYLDWRNIDAEQILRSYPESKIYLLRYYNITKPLYDMHLIRHRQDSRRYGYNSQVDCNHFCWMPTLWQPVWKTIYMITLRMKE